MTVSPGIRSVTLSLLVGIAALALPGPSAAAPGRILTEPPARPDAKARYLFYLHGRIVQEQGRKAVSPKFGPYDYDGILRRLADGGFQVISEVRPRGVDASTSADRVAGQVRHLLDAGVPPRRIAIVGASMGAYITLLVSSRIADPEVGYAILGICSEETGALGAGLHGDFLSIFESSDSPSGSCAALFADAPLLTRHAEIRLDTGLQHGYLYRALPEWIDPVLRWAGDRAGGGAAGGLDSAGGGETADTRLAPFIAMAKNAECADRVNRLFRIDGTLVFWERAGNCPDNGGASVLYGKGVEDVLCSLSDSIAGPMKSCREPAYREMFETILAHPDRSDLGLGPTHRVVPIPIGGEDPRGTRGKPAPAVVP